MVVVEDGNLRNGAQWSKWWLVGEDGNREEIFGGFSLRGKEVG